MTRPMSDTTSSLYTRRVSLECGRLVVNRIEYLLRTRAICKGVELQLDIRKGWIECFIYAKASGSEPAVRAWCESVKYIVETYNEE